MFGAIMKKLRQRQGYPGRQSGGGGPALLHPERRGEADVRLRRQQGGGRQRPLGAHGGRGGAGRLSGLRRGAAAPLSAA